MNITDHLDRAIDAVPGPDLTRLSRVAAAQGTRARRRRRTAIGAGAVLGLGLVGAALSVLPGSPAAPVPIASDGAQPHAVVPSAGPTAAITDRGAVAALRDLVTQQVPGTTDEYAGQGQAPGSAPHHEMFVSLALRPDGDPGATIIGVNIQPPEPGADRGGCGRGTPRRVDCSDVTLPDGSRLLSFETREDSVGGVGITRVATVVRPSGDTVAITATNGYDGQRGVWTITRPQPALTLEQVRELVTQPLWLDAFPAAYVDQGATLAPWSDLNGDPGTF